MPARAFLIAIQQYKAMKEGLSSDLPGTHAQALAFRQWLRKDNRVAEPDIFFCTDDPTLPGRTADADRAAIVRELRRLKDAGKDTTPELFFYFSGHGFCFVDGNGAPVTDVLLGADYETREDSAAACLRLVEIQKWLKMCLGPGDHYYFVDACRNELGVADIDPTTLGLKYDPSAKARPTVFTLFSTTTGTLAEVGDTFPKAIIDGLEGRGRAKVWRGPSLVVHFESLRAYAEQRLGKNLDPRKEGSSEGLLKQFAQPPKQTCRVLVADAAPEDEFELVVKDVRGRDIDKTPVTGSTGQYTADPDDYLLALQPKAGSGLLVEPPVPRAVDLYDDCEVQYLRKEDEGLESLDEGDPLEGTAAGEPRAAFAAEPVVTLSVVPPENATVVIRSIGRDATEWRVQSPDLLSLPPGRYAIETVDLRGAVLDREERELSTGTATIDRSAFRRSPLRDTLLTMVPNSGGAVYMSETLGPIVDQGLDLWLAIIGAARIIGPERFSKLGPLPLASFAGAQAGDAPLYLLAGLESAGAGLRVAVSTDWRTAPEPVALHPQISGLYEVVRDGHAGHQYVTVQVADRPPLTFGAYTLPNRGTLITVTADARHAVHVQQFVLPLGPVAHLLPFGGGFCLPELGELSEPLRVVRRLVEVQRGFERSVDLGSILSFFELDFLLRFKWFEPVVALLAAYELVRRDTRDLLPVVVDNLRANFPGLADTEALARLIGRPEQPMIAPPIVLDGFESMNLEVRGADLPPTDRLDFTGPWTMWRAASGRE